MQPWTRRALRWSWMRWTPCGAACRQRSRRAPAAYSKPSVRASSARLCSRSPVGLTTCGLHGPNPGFHEFVPYLDAKAAGSADDATLGALFTCVRRSGWQAGSLDATTHAWSAASYSAGLQAMKRDTRRYARRQVSWVRRRLWPVIAAPEPSSTAAATMLPCSLAVLDSSGEAAALGPCCWQRRDADISLSLSLSLSRILR